jgi:hypothetical protein
MIPRRARLLVTLLFALASASGCRQLPFFHAQPAAEDVDFGRRFLALFGTRSMPAIEMGIDPALREPQLRLRIMQMASLVPPGDPIAVSLVDSSVTKSGNTTTTSLSFQYQYTDRYLLEELVVERKGSAPVVRGVQIRPLRESLAQANRFTFQGKPWPHYVALAAAGAVMLTVLYTFVLALRTAVPSMKWMWVAFVLVGVVQFTFNWTTGTLSVALLGVQLLGSSFAKASPFKPLLITTSIPIGAIIFLIQRREWMGDGYGRPAATPMPEQDGTGTASDYRDDT